MKLSEISDEYVAQYVREEEPDTAVMNEIKIITAAAKAYIKGYTDLTYEQIDEHEDLSAAYMVLCSEMYDSRTFTVNNDKVNPLVKSILNLYALNCIG